MYKIKQIPEDFKVKEIIEINLSTIGSYAYFALKKKNYTTSDALKILSNTAKIPLKHFGFAGNKDKHAITEQIISIKSPNLRILKNIKLEHIELEYIGMGKEPVSLGDLKINEFDIIVRKLVNEDIDMMDKRILNIQGIPNYFDEQRFSENNVEIGLMLLKRKFKDACSLIKDEAMKSYLETRESDYIGALRLLPKKILLLYIHSVQSFIFNQTLCKIIKKGRKISYSMGKLIFPDKAIKNKKIPTVGFGVDYYGKNIEKIIKSILKKLQINERSFIFKEIPEISTEGNERDMLMSIRNLSIKEIGKDTMNKGKFYARLSFSLGKGSYATIVIKYLFQ